jgi:hypothetical protein
MSPAPFLTILRLARRPDTLADAAAQTSNRAALTTALPAWAVVLSTPLVGGGLSEPYISWRSYLQDTLLFATLCILFAVALAVMWCAALNYAARRNTGLQAAKSRALMLSAVPLIAPLLLILPCQIVARSQGQIFPQPAFTLWSGWNFFSSPRWLLVLAAGWCVMVVHSWLVLSRHDDWRKSGCCLRCGYDLRGTRDPCPECGAPNDRAHEP